MNLRDLSVAILSLAVGACLVIAFIGAVFGKHEIGVPGAYLIFTALGGVIGILASRLAHKPREEDDDAAA